jgi:hypothetical protein
MSLRTIVLLAALSLTGIATVAAATDLRGRVDGRNPNGYVFPRAGATVALYQQTGAGWTLVRQTQSGADGMYYFPGIAPGGYGLQVNTLNFPLQVSANPAQDIPAVVVP